MADRRRAPHDGRILIVEDDPGIRRLTVEILEDDGYATEAVADGAEALAAIERRRPALMLLDMRMPRLDGWQLADHLRAQGLEIPTVVVTAAQDVALRGEAIAAQGVLSKPFDVADLLTEVRRVYPGRGEARKRR